MLIAVLRFPGIDEQNPVLFEARLGKALSLDIGHKCIASVAYRHSGARFFLYAPRDLPIAHQFAGASPVPKIQGLVDARRASQVSVYPYWTAAIVVAAIAVCTLAVPESAALYVTSVQIEHRVCMLRNLEPFVNAIKDTFGNPDSPVTAPFFPGRRLEY